MAITVITEPKDVIAAYNPFVITCSSDNSALTNFKYVFEVYDGATLIAKLKINQRPDTYGLFNAQRVVENYLTSDFTIADATDALPCVNSYKDIVVKIGEEYGATPVEYLDLAEVSPSIINAALKHSVASFGSETNYIDVDFRAQYMMSNLTTGLSKPFLTSSPRTICLDSDQNYYLYALVNTSNAPTKLRLRTYNSSGTLITSHDKTLSATTDLIVRYGVGTKNINEWDASYLTGVSSYDIRLFNNPGIGSPAPISELFTFNIGCDCSKFNEKFRLHWLNPLGGYDAFNFKHAYGHDFDIARSTFQKVLGTMNSSTGEFAYAVSDRGKINFDNLTTETVKINSNWITEEEAKWLLSLVKSTDVLLEINSTTYAPVSIVNKNYQSKNYASDDKLFNLELTIEISNKIISQRW